MSDIHYIKIIVRNRNINPMKGDILQKNNTGFPSVTGSPYYMEMGTFRALIKYIDIEKKKKPSIRFHVSKNSPLYIGNPLDVMKDLQLVNPQAIRL